MAAKNKDANVISYAIYRKHVLFSSPGEFIGRDYNMMRISKELILKCAERIREIEKVDSMSYAAKLKGNRRQDHG